MRKSTSDGSMLITYVPADLMQLSQLEDYIFNVEYDNIEECKKYIDDIPYKTVMRLIEHVATYVRPFHFNVLGDIYRQVFPPREKIHSHSPFIHYLFNKGIIKKENLLRSFTGISNNFISDMNIKPDTCWSYAQSDDFRGLVSSSIYTDLTKQKNTLLKQRITLLDFSAFCGSVNSFKYLMLNGCEITDDTVDFSIKGGNESIIELIEQKGFEFNNKLHTAIKAHNNQIVEWLITNFTCELITLPYCISNWNIQCFFYLLSNGHNLNEIDSAGKNVFQRASENYNYILNQKLLRLNLRLHRQKFNTH